VISLKVLLGAVVAKGPEDAAAAEAAELLMRFAENDIVIAPALGFRTVSAGGEWLRLALLLLH